MLAGEKQRLGRDYDFSEVIKWFAERADLIIVMFDAHKLDISDELKSVLDTLKPHQVGIHHIHMHSVIHTYIHTYTHTNPFIALILHRIFEITGKDSRVAEQSRHDRRPVFVASLWSIDVGIR